MFKNIFYFHYLDINYLLRKQYIKTLEKLHMIYIRSNRVKGNSYGHKSILPH